jgi:hypothetical protein
MAWTPRCPICRTLLSERTKYLGQPSYCEKCGRDFPLVQPPENHLVDSRVYDLAQLFVDDTLQEQGQKLPEERRKEIIQRLAEDVQHAVEDVCADIEMELAALRKGVH